MHMVTLVIAGLAVGTTVLLGQLIGQKNQKECGKVVGTTIFSFVCAKVGRTLAKSE